MNAYLAHIAVEVCILSMLAISLNLMAGYSGLMSLGQMTFYAIGAYAAALLAPASGLGYVIVLPVAIFLAMALAFMESAVTIRLKEDEFAIATFAMHIAFWTLLMNWTALTKGPLGISGIPPITIFNITLDDPTKFVFLAVVSLIAMQLLVARIIHRPFGVLMRMVRDDEELARNCGRNTRRFRTSVWVASAAMAAAAGVLQAAYIGYVNPSSFSSMESTILLAIVILGGAGTYWGPVVGAVIIVCVPEGLRFLGLPTPQADNIRQILLGGVLIAAASPAAFTRRGALSLSRHGAAS